MTFPACRAAFARGLRRLGAASLALAALGGALAAGPDTAPRRLLAAHEQADWKGVGRLDLAGQGYCTATLVTETLALTAAHCLHDSRGGGRLRDADLFFAAGWRGGRHQAIRQVRRSAVHPEYRYGGVRADYEEIAADVALVELDQPVLTSEIPNYALTELPEPGGAVALLSYGRGRSWALSRQEPCRVEARWPRVARLDCEVAPGSSGSPVFARVNGEPRLAAVVSAGARGAAFAVVLSEVMPELRAALTRQEPSRKVSAAPSAAGARLGSLAGSGAGATAGSAAGSMAGVGGGRKTSRPPGN